MSNHRPPTAPFNAPQPGGDPFAPEVVDEQVAYRLGPLNPQMRPDGETRLVRALASAYALPVASEQSLARARARVHTAQVPPGQPHGPSGGYTSRLTSTRSGGGSPPTGTLPRRHGPNRGLWAGIAAAVVVALLVGLFARLLSARSPASPPAPAPTYGVIYTFSLACPADQANCHIASAIAATEQILTQRVNHFNGYTFAAVTQTGPTTLQAKVPGAQNTENLRALLTHTGRLTFIDTGTTQVQVGTTVTSGQYPVVFTSSQLDPASISAGTDPGSGEPIVTFAFTGSARTQFAQYTQSHVGEYLTIALDNTIVESATIQSQIDGLGQITGIGTVDQAKLIAALLKSQLLPLAVTITATQTYGSSTPVPTVPPATATATTQTGVAPGTGWTAMPGLVQPGGMPSVAPTNANTAYIFNFPTSSCKGCAQPSPLLERTEDGGATWQPMTMPSQLKGINYADGAAIAMPVEVSPVDAHLIFETVSLMANQCPEPAYQYSCLVTFRSADAGNSWQMLSFPVHGALEGTPVGMPSALQGGDQRLYATINTEVPASSGTMPSARLVVSDDDGQTWKVADAALAGQHLGIAAYAVSRYTYPGGDSLYAITEPVNAGSETYTPTYALWASSDSGATWTQATLPIPNPQGLTVASFPDHDAPYLFGSDAYAEPAYYASQDRGAHWTTAPTAGLPSGARVVTGPFGVFGDAVVAATSDGSVYSWQLGKTSWYAVAPPPAANVHSGDYAVTISLNNAQSVLVAVYGTNNGWAAAYYTIP